MQTKYWGFPCLMQKSKDDLQRDSISTFPICKTNFYVLRVQKEARMRVTSTIRNGGLFHKEKRS